MTSGGIFLHVYNVPCLQWITDAISATLAYLFRCGAGGGYMLDMDIREYGTCRDKFSAISENRCAVLAAGADVTLMSKKCQKDIKTGS